MPAPSFDIIETGDELPSLELPPLDRLTLALYCAASGDHNPIHVDIDYARDVAGLEDVIGHGTLTMAWLGRLLTRWAPQNQVRRFKTRFLSPVRVGNRITCRGTVVEKITGVENLIRVELQAVNETGALLATGEAEVVFDNQDRGNGI